ncbi:MAG: hypothetical protein C5B57_11755 [Blastocatellia bacterium]|nr:MAG: hypothetical protein C5B57_11755 [Blastocatellia bacterium]
MLRRARGVILRLARRRVLAITVGTVLLVPAIWLKGSGAYPAWWADGVSLVLGATGVAFLWTGLVGVRPDYVDNEVRPPR